MNDKRTTYRWLSALSALLLLSCSQEEIMPGGVSEGDDIIFHVNMPGVETGTRSYDNIQEGDLQGGFSVAALYLEREGPGTLELYFQNKLVEKTEGMGDAFRGRDCKWPPSQNGKDGKLKFFAFYPSIETLKSKLINDPDDKTDYFLVHHSPLSQLNADGTYSFNYRMGNFKVNKDISTHADFVSASVEGSKSDNLYSGIELKFEHKLCRVDLKAWGGNKDYDIEIAGVRIGGVMTKSTYNLAGNWISHAATWGSVEYIFNEGNASREADQVVRIGSGAYDTSKKATSIMGNGGYAMMIPHRPSNLTAGKPGKWSTSNTGGMYFSVLLRVIDKTDNQGLILYPYVYGSTISSGITATNSNVVYLTVENATGKITGRVYRNEDTGNYFSDEKKTIPFSVNNGEEIRCYGWAAIPYYQDWYINNQYTYTLDYSKGVGVGDPADPNKGKAIITPLSVGVSESGGDWEIVKNYDEVTLEEGEDKDFTYEQE